MRHSFAFGSVELDGVWHDRSTIHFVGDAAGGERLPGTGAKTRGPLLSVTLTSGELGQSLDLTAAVAAQEAELQRTFGSFRIVSRAPWTHPTYGAVPQLDFSFEASPGTVVRQRQCYFRWPTGDRFSCLALACEAVAFDAAVATLEAIFASFLVE